MKLEIKSVQGTNIIVGLTDFDGDYSEKEYTPYDLSTLMLELSEFNSTVVNTLDNLEAPKAKFKKGQTVYFFFEDKICQEEIKGVYYPDPEYHSEEYLYNFDKGYIGEHFLFASREELAKELESQGSDK